jgi:hypothetical protein
MSTYALNDICGIPNTGAQQQNLSDIICQSPKAASNWLSGYGVYRRDHSVPGDSGSFSYLVLHNRYNQPQINIVISG